MQLSFEPIIGFEVVVMLSFFLFLFFNNSFAREVSPTGVLEYSDLTNTEVPKCQPLDLETRPVCRFSRPQGYVTLWEVRNQKSFRCKETVLFSEKLSEQNIPEEWNPGTTKICGAYWSGNQKLNLGTAGSIVPLKPVKFSTCSSEQVKTIYSLCSLSILPSTLQSFTANYNRDLKCVSVNFKTIVAEDVLTATIERSFDGKVFEDIATIPSNLKNNGIYSYLDCASKKSGSYFYRVRQRDHRGGQKTYHAIQMLMPETTSELKLSEVAVRDELRFSLNNMKAGALSLTIYDHAGNLIEEKTAALGGGFPEVTLKVRSYSAGTYILKVGREEWVQVGKFVISR